MLDPKYVREHLAEVRENCRVRNVSVDIDGWLALDQERSELIKQTEAVRAERNTIADSMKSAAAAERPALIEKGKSLKESSTVQEARLNEVEAAWKTLILALPNRTHVDAPVGNTDEDNRELRAVGQIAPLEQPLDHVALCAKHDVLDFERAAKVTGAKFYYLKGKLVLLEQALIRFALDLVAQEGFTLMSTPDLAKDEIIVGTGFNPRGPETQVYSIENSDMSLVGTSEITLGGFHKDEMLPGSAMPIKYAGLSHCYRTEAGTYGRESYGLYRVHQFSKVEMYVFCAPEQSEAMHLELLRIEELVFKTLEIPYRVIDTCTGDLGGPAYRKYDLEAWMWGRGEGKGGWGEVTSTSNCLDYQARRLNVRIKNAEGENSYAHTLNGTVLSMARALIAVLENHQQADGSIKIPAALIPYCGFDRIG